MRRVRRAINVSGFMLIMALKRSDSELKVGGPL